MNVVSLIGRMTAEPELKQTTTGKTVLRFTLAVKRSFGDKTDFIRCEAWNKTAETMAKFLKKGDPVAVSGTWQVDSIAGADGKTTYYNTCSVERFYFVPRVKSDAKGAVNAAYGVASQATASQFTAPAPIAVDAKFTTGTPFDPKFL